ncbi:hypothetical protein [Caudoviricetes sp.]|nr:hypothetical protein [Caudoviricetes sp.]UOF79687.1 hypothetical protein [Caudoviricetes sp.]UOF79839.1 hypothetical protein [Bacteriophage sp.]UOF81358.1 hypothetical protein [Caudoviricetes sp.]
MDRNADPRAAADQNPLGAVLGLGHRRRRLADEPAPVEGLLAQTGIPHCH